METESWKPIPEYEMYEVSSLGRVRNLKGVVLKHQLDARGYPLLNLSVRSKKRTHRIHKLVALAFLGESNGLTVNHIDENKLNNEVSNLEYVTYRQNSAHSTKRKDGLPVVVAKERTRYVARIWVNGKGTRSQPYDTPEEAQQHYLSIVRENP